MDRIKIGDTVDVHFENVMPIRDAKVVELPSDKNGGSWILRSDTLYYVKHFAFIAVVTDDLLTLRGQAIEDIFK